MFQCMPSLILHRLHEAVHTEIKHLDLEIQRHKAYILKSVGSVRSVNAVMNMRQYVCTKIISKTVTK
jgi:hypothetical protein